MVFREMITTTQPVGKSSRIVFLDMMKSLMSSKNLCKISKTSRRYLMIDEQTRYDDAIKGLRNRTVDKHELHKFISNSTECIRFKGVKFKTSRPSEAPGGAQGPGKNPVVVINRDLGEYIAISGQDYSDAKNGEFASLASEAESYWL
jgi:hypothetical protein